MILKKLEMFKELNGYLASGVFDAYGKMLAGVMEVAGLSFETAGSLFHDALLFTDNISKEAGFGPVQMVQIDTEIGIVFAKCCIEEEIHFHTLLVVKNTANIVMSKHMLTKMVDTLKEEFKEMAKSTEPFTFL